MPRDLKSDRRVVKDANNHFRNIQVNIFFICNGFPCWVCHSKKVFVFVVINVSAEGFYITVETHVGNKECMA